MAVVDEVERGELVLAGTEEEVLWAMVDFYRATLLVKCAGLSADQLATRSVPPSTLTLLGLVRHMTIVERYWFQHVFVGSDPDPLYHDDDDPDYEFNVLDDVAPSESIANYRAARDASREIGATHDLSEIGARRREDVEVSLRYIAVHMVDEYARHCGHADLLREAIDGETGD